MKKIFAALLVVLQLLALCSCKEVLSELIKELESYEFTQSPRTDPAETAETERADTGNPIPFVRVPEVPEYKLPDEKFDDPVERDASEIIDRAIEKAIAAVNAVKDGRHSSVSYGYEEDANGYIAELSDGEKELYYKFTEKAGQVRDCAVYAYEYDGDLKTAYFSLYRPFTYCRPDIASFCMMTPVSFADADYETHYSQIYNAYFDPYKDANTRTDNSSLTPDDVKKAADLQDHIIKRIVRLMPEGLSTYDKYYYLAAVLCEHVLYDDRPANCFNAFGALVCGKAVCEGYTAAYMLLCREADLWCAYRDGMSNHTWNMVKLDSGIYNVDVTWCDGESNTVSPAWYDNFMRSDEAFSDNGHDVSSGILSTGKFEPSPYDSERNE